MLIIIYGWRTMVTGCWPKDVLFNSCPNCEGDLRLSKVKRWFTFFYIPLFPYSTLETIYRCKSCKSFYREGIKNAVIGSQEEMDQFKHEVKRMFALTLAACMTHMSGIDYEVSIEELDSIYEMTRTYSEFEAEMNKIIDKVRESDDDETVFNILRGAARVLPKVAIMLIISQVAKVLLADGEIHPNEEWLLKEYLRICGIPECLYQNIIDMGDDIQMTSDTGLTHESL